MPHAYTDRTVYYGDLHNHCGSSYGHGSLEGIVNLSRGRAIEKVQKLGEARRVALLSPSPGCR